MNLDFSGIVFFWRGPAPYYFVAVPEEQSEAIKTISNLVTYGWGVIPVRATIGETEFKTSLFPKDGLYLVPIRASVRKAEEVDEGDEVIIHLEIRP